MSKYLVDKYVRDSTYEVLKQSNEYKMYDIGAATGSFQMLKACKLLIGEDTYKEIIAAWKKDTGEIQKHFNKLVELDERQNSKVEDILEERESFEQKKEK